MPFLLVLVISIVLLAAVGLVAWLMWRSVREQAIMRRTLDVVMLKVMLPKDITREEKEGVTEDQTKEKIAVAEQFLSTLSSLPTTVWNRFLYGRPIIVFEMAVGGDGVISFYAGTERKYLDHMEKQIYALYPEAEVVTSTDYTMFERGDSIRTGVLRLRKKPHLPIATYQELGTDPMQSLTGALAKVRLSDAVVIQLVCRAASAKTRGRGRKAARQTVRGEQSDVGSVRQMQLITKKKDKIEKEEQKASQLTPRTQERVELVERKMAQQQFDVNIRVGVSVRGEEEADRIFDGIGAAFGQYDLPDLNSLVVRRQKKASRLLRDLIFRVPRERMANTLSVAEVSSLFHFPLATTETPNILWRKAKVAPVPPDLPKKGVVLGNNIYRGVETPIYFAPDDRRRHLYMVGQTGTGKTTLFLNQIVQDIKAGRGVGVVDPHGDLIEDILLNIPAERVQDVILFDPRDTERPLGFNILEVREEAQKDLIVNEVVQILQKLAARLNPESIGPMFEHYLRNALLSLVEDPEATLIDVPRMFVDEEFREKILKKVDNPTVKQFWEKEFKQSQRGQMSADMLSYVISKLGRFVSNRTMRNLIGQSKSSFDMREIMDQQKILLCNLSKGSLGDINSDLLGFVLVSKIQVAAMGRADAPEEKRPDFYLYLDEFQNFTTDSIVTVLSEARKYRLNLNLTHQFINQLSDEIRDAVFGNVGTMISFRVGAEDSESLVKQFEPVFSEYDLVNLEQFMAVVRLLVKGTPQRAFSLKTMAPPEPVDVGVSEAVRKYSRETYGRSVVDVERNILERFQYGSDNVSGGSDKAAEGDYLSESLFDVS